MPFIKEFTVTKEFEDEPYKVTMKRMKRKDALKLTPFMSEPDENGEVKLSFQDKMDMLDVAADMLPKYITGIEYNGEIHDSKSELATNIIEEAYFMALAGELIGELVDHSFTKDKTKIKKPQPSTSAESETTSPSSLKAD